MSTEDHLQAAWDLASSDDSQQLWYAKLDELDVFDGVAFAYDQQEPGTVVKSQGLAQWVQKEALTESKLRDLSALDRPQVMFFRTVERLIYRMRRALEEVLGPDDLRPVPDQGTLQYFSDDLRFSLLIGYRSSGVVTFTEALALEEPVLLADPVALIEAAQSDRELQLVVNAVRSAHKVVMLRNVLVHVDRAATPSVFGPSIDTLVVTDWFLTNRFAGQRLEESLTPFFGDPLKREATRQLRQAGSRILEVGSGSGLILAAFTRNEARLRSFKAVDIELDAIGATYRNTYRQRQLHLGWIGDLGSYTVGPYASDEERAYDLVICNPPYIPEPPGDRGRDTLSGATMGTDLLELVVRDTLQLVPAGDLFMIMSNISLMQFRRAMPDAVDATELLRRSVPFRIESAGLDGDKDALQFLKRAGLRVNRGKGGQARYEHDIVMFRLRRSDRP